VAHYLLSAPSQLKKFVLCFSFSPSQTGRRLAMKSIYFAAVLALAPAVAVAETSATGEQITAAIGGNTVQGSMVEAGAYTEFYQTDGIIKGADYTGKWSVKDDKMCFDYGEGASCWAVRIESDAVTWLKDGVDDGTGTIVAGNPNNY
jgi:hypothetical protein